MTLKICGMRDKKNILDVSAVGVDYMGFIFYKGSPRFVGETFDVPDIPASVKRVGVFVNETAEEILKKVQTHRLDFVQLHGDEAPNLCEALKAHNVGVIKVFSVDNTFDFRTAKSYTQVVDFFLFDTKGKHRGGNAFRFDWTLLQNYDQEVPFFLSGGIGPENLQDVEALRGMNLHAIDVNSGVETSPALKDIEKVRLIKEYLQTKETRLK